MSKFVLEDLNSTVGTIEVDLPDHMTRIPFADIDPKMVKRAVITGDGHTLYVGANTSLIDMRFKISGRNNTVIVGSNCTMRGIISIKGRDRVVLIGAYTTFNDVAITCKYDGHVYIGKDCMFSSDIEVRTSDSHAIVDLETMQRCNPATGVYIGDHVWVGKNVVINNGAAVGDDNIIAMGAFVGGDFRDSNTILAGAPARVARNKRSWSRSELVDPSVTDIFAWKRYDLL